jgi:hypothetical protein
MPDTGAAFETVFILHHFNSNYPRCSSVKYKTIACKQFKNEVAFYF